MHLYGIELCCIKLYIYTHVCMCVIGVQLAEKYVKVNYMYLQVSCNKMIPLARTCGKEFIITSQVYVSALSLAVKDGIVK